jgi:hypothetical protein
MARRTRVSKRRKRSRRTKVARRSKVDRRSKVGRRSRRSKVGRRSRRSKVGRRSRRLKGGAGALGVNEAEGAEEKADEIALINTIQAAQPGADETEQALSGKATAGYLAFVNEQRGRLQKAHPKLSDSNIIKQLEGMWGSMHKDRKKSYETESLLGNLTPSSVQSARFLKGGRRDWDMEPLTVEERSWASEWLHEELTSSQLMELTQSMRATGKTYDKDALIGLIVTEGPKKKGNFVEVIIRMREDAFRRLEEAGKSTPFRFSQIKAVMDGRIKAIKYLSGKGLTRENITAVMDNFPEVEAVLMARSDEERTRRGDFAAKRQKAPGEAWGDAKEPDFYDAAISPDAGTGLPPRRATRLMPFTAGGPMDPSTFVESLGKTLRGFNYEGTEQEARPVERLGRWWRAGGPWE